MKLLFELPDREKEAAAVRLENKEVLYCIPYDLDVSGRYVDGWVVITSTKLLCLAGGSIISDINIPEGSDYKAEGLVGSGILEVILGGEPMIIARYTMSHVPRYTYIARALNCLSKGEAPAIECEEDEPVCPRCGRVYPQDSRVCIACVNKLAVFVKFWGLMKPFKLHITLAGMLFLAITALQLINPYIYRIFIDGYLMPMKRNFSGFLLCIAAISGCHLLNALLSIARGRVMVSVGSKLSMELRAMVYTKIQSLSLRYHNKRKTGDLMNRVTGDTVRIRDFIQFQSAMGLNQMLILSGVCVILFLSNWKLALMVVLPVPLVLIGTKLVWRWIRVAFHNQSRVWDKLNSLLQDILSGVRVVKAFGQEEKEIRRFKTNARLLADLQARNDKRFNTIFPCMGFIIGAGQFLVLYYGSRLVLGQDIQLGELVQFTQYTALLYGPLSWLSMMPRWFAESMTATERVFEILDEEPDIKDSKQAARHRIEGKVTFRNVSFGYQSHEPVLEDISLEVVQGEMIGLVGHSGAGKSTLINLVMRLYDVDHGQILIDGKDIRDISQQDLRSQIGVVLQETFLFSGTILENIRYSKPDAGLDEVIMAARIANAHDFIMKFPDGYDTKVGENGQTLSGGERQRISIARAILHNPRILILDEATASLDTEAEQQIQEALGRLVKNRTTFAIAHRLSTLRNASRLLVIEKGKQAELGTHEELLKTRGIYYKLVMAQRQVTKMQRAENL